MISKKTKAENFIKNKIKSGEWTGKLPSEPTLMEMLNVGRSTLREAISSLVAQNILYRKPCAGVFVREKGKIIYFFDRSNSNFHLFYDSIKDKVGELLTAQGYELVFQYFADEASLKYFEQILDSDNKIKGVISEFSLRNLENKLDDKNIPYVNISTAIPVSCNNVVMDYYYMLALACGLMNIKGHRDFYVMYIDYFTCSLVDKNNRDGKRFEYIIDLCRKMVNNDENRLIKVPWTPSLEEAYFSFKEWWLNVKKPASIVFIDDALTSMATRAIGEFGMKIPEELALISIGDILSNYPTKIPYTKLYHSYEIVARETVRLLTDLIDGKTEKGKTVYLKSDVFIGKSI
ncbi:MAG: GntR family transcriptional regulator [Armatimonadetes bacterium]|nr:GntR family transcriptional regulator [Candidatus Hippobium faecium]